MSSVRANGKGATTQAGTIEEEGEHRVDQWFACETQFVYRPNRLLFKQFCWIWPFLMKLRILFFKCRNNYLRLKLIEIEEPLQAVSQFRQSAGCLFLIASVSGIWTWHFGAKRPIGIATGLVLFAPWKHTIHDELDTGPWQPVDRQSVNGWCKSIRASDIIQS